MDGVVPLTALAFRFVLASILLLSGLGKLPHLRQFERAVRRYELLPDRLARPVARALPWLELLFASLLFLGLAIVPVAVTAASLLTIFSIAVAINLLRGRRIDCGCFTPGVPSTIGWVTVARNAGLIAMAAVVASAHPAGLGLDSVVLGAHTHASSSSALAMLVAATVAVLCFVVFGEGVNVVRKSRAPRSIGVQR